MMLVKIANTVELKEIPHEAFKVIQNIHNGILNQTKESIHEVMTFLATHEGYDDESHHNLIAMVRKLEKTREMLSKIDNKLADTVEMLTGYINIHQQIQEKGEQSLSQESSYIGSNQETLSTENERELKQEESKQPG